MLNNIFSFKGKANRKDFWLTVLLVGLPVSLLLELVSPLLKAFVGYPQDPQVHVMADIDLKYKLLKSILLFSPLSGVLIRRSNDLNISSWCLPLLFLPLVGWIYFLVLGFSKGEKKVLSCG